MEIISASTFQIMRENGWEATWDGVIKEDISEEVIFK